MQQIASDSARCKVHADMRLVASSCLATTLITIRVSFSAAAIDHGLTVTGTPRADGVIAFASTLTNTRVEIPPGNLHPRTDAPWVNYALGVLQQFERAGHKIGGFDAEVSGDVPAGAGLSSSAAFEVAMAGFLMALHGIRLEPMAVAKLCQRAENEFVGVHSRVAGSSDVGLRSRRSRCASRFSNRRGHDHSVSHRARAGDRGLGRESTIFCGANTMRAARNAPRRRKRLTR